MWWKVNRCPLLSSPSTLFSSTAEATVTHAYPSKRVYGADPIVRIAIRHLNRSFNLLLSLSNLGTIVSISRQRDKHEPAFELRYDGARHRGIKVLKQNFSVTPGFGLIVSSKCSRFSNSRSQTARNFRIASSSREATKPVFHISLPTGESFDWAQSPLFYDEPPSSPLEWISTISRPSPQLLHNTWSFGQLYWCGIHWRPFQLSIEWSGNDNGHH